MLLKTQPCYQLRVLLLVIYIMSGPKSGFLFNPIYTCSFKVIGGPLIFISKIIFADFPFFFSITRILAPIKYTI